MNNLTSEQITRAWKDEVYRQTLTATQLAQLPPSPSQLAELNDEELEHVAGGAAGCHCRCKAGGTVTQTDAQ